MSEYDEDEDTLDGVIEAVVQEVGAAGARNLKAVAQEVGGGWRNPAVAAAPPSSALVRQVEPEVRAAREKADRAAEEVERAKAALEKAEREAEQIAAEIEEQRRAAEEQRWEAVFAAEEARRDALRPAEAEYEIEVLDIFDEGRFGAKKAIEFIARGAPNFASYRGGDPVLRAYVYLLPISVGVWKHPSTYYPFTQEAAKQLQSGERAAPLVEKLGYPRSRSLDNFYTSEVVDQKPRELTPEIIEAACGMVLKEHLDMVDAERARTGEPALDRTFVKQKMKARA